MENRGQFRSVISFVLGKMSFYYLPLAKLTEILRLLEMPETSEANTILQYVYSGITRLYQKHKQKIGNHLFSQKFSNISKESKELLYTLFTHIHNIILSKQQTTMQQGPYNMDMIYPPGSNLGAQQSNLYSDQMKKYMETLKMYPYQLMNPQINPSYNPNIAANLAPGLHSQFGMPIHMGNPYMNYPGNPSVGPYGQFKNIPRTVPPASIPFGMNPFPTPTNISSLYPPQYVNPYQNPMMGGYGLTPPHSYAHMMGLEKNDLSSKIPQFPNFISNNQIEKRYSIPHGKPDQNSKNDKQRSLQKDTKQINHSLKTPYNTQSQNIPVPKSNDILTKSNSVTEFLPKKLPHKDTKILVEQDPVFKSCACKGYFQYDTSFTCSVCKNKFHYRCLSIPQKPEDYAFNQIGCAHCKMRGMDPLNKVAQKIGEFYMMNLFEKNFQCVLNFKPYEAKCRQKNSKYDIQVRCIRSGQHMKNLQITWPDECLIKINGQKILDIPALQSNSSLKKRKDFSVSITQNIYSKAGLAHEGFANILEKVKILLELKPITVEEANTKRIRNDYTFALGIYLVEKLNVEDLFNKVLSQEKVEDKNFMKNLMKTNQNEVEIDKITIRLLDPYSWDYIKTPVRGTKCTHAQCFDLKTFISLMYSAKNRTWKCPLCSKDCRKFMLDNQQLQLIKKAQQYEPVPKEVSVYKEGKVAFKIERDENCDDDDFSALPKTKKISKPKKEQAVKQK